MPFWELEAIAGLGAVGITRTYGAYNLHRYSLKRREALQGRAHLRVCQGRAPKAVAHMWLGGTGRCDTRRSAHRSMPCGGLWSVVVE